MQERYTVKVALFLVLMRIVDGNVEILLHRRKNTGYMDDMYEIACNGHLEANESLKGAIVRKAKEELGIRVFEKDLEFVSMIHPVEEGYLNIFFSTSSYYGTPTIVKEDKYDDLKWAKIDELPSNTIWKVREVIRNISEGIIYDTSDYCAQDKLIN